MSPKQHFQLRFAVAFAAVAFGLIVVLTFEFPSVDTVQRGYRGVAMGLVENHKTEAALVAANVLPEETPPVDPLGQPASAVYQNVQVLKDVDAGEFVRLMTDITTWVAPQQGCSYCHAEGEEYSSDKLYTKVVARRMIQMVQHVNADWKTHVANTGVTCYTCHHGQPVPANIWFNQPDTLRSEGLLGNKAGQNMPALAAGLASLPYDPFTPLLEYANEIRVISNTALPDGNRTSIKQTEWTYSLMMHISKALGVNCTFCHNSRSFAQWDQSTPQRATAWYGIRMVRDLNNAYLSPLVSTFPAERLGPLGDTAKVNCATCHQGAYKPLLGASMLKDYPELAVLATTTASPSGAAMPAQPK
jgi:photosynthetic reaction center cytochrome c subunit